MQQLVGGETQTVEMCLLRPRAAISEFQVHHAALPSASAQILRSSSGPTLKLEFAEYLKRGFRSYTLRRTNSRGRLRVVITRRSLPEKQSDHFGRAYFDG